MTTPAAPFCSATHHLVHLCSTPIRTFVCLLGNTGAWRGGETNTLTLERRTVGAVSGRRGFFVCFFSAVSNRGEIEASPRPGRLAACGEIPRAHASPSRKSIRPPSRSPEFMRDDNPARELANAVCLQRGRRINCVDSGEEYLHSLSQFSEMSLQPQRELAAIRPAVRDDYNYSLTSAPKCVLSD